MPSFQNLKNPHLLVRCLVAAYRSSLDDLVLPLCKYIANVHYGTFAECYRDDVRNCK